MNYETRERLATDFAEVIGSIREEKWDAFSAAAEQDNLAPYVALARLLVRIVEKEFTPSPDSDGAN